MSQQKTKQSFFHQAAQYSVLAPIVSIVLAIYLNGSAHASGDLNSTNLVGLIVGIVTSFLILSGFLMGIVAMFGIRKYGRKGIFGRALAGILIGSAFILAAIVASSVRS